MREKAILVEHGVDIELVEEGYWDDNYDAYLKDDRQLHSYYDKVEENDEVIEQLQTKINKEVLKEDLEIVKRYNQKPQFYFLVKSVSILLFCLILSYITTVF